VFPINNVAGSMWGLRFYIKMGQRSIKITYFCATLQFSPRWRTVLVYLQTRWKTEMCSCTICNMAYKSGFHANSFQFMFWVYASVSSAVDVYLVPKVSVRVDKDSQDNAALLLLVRALKLV